MNEKITLHSPASSYFKWERWQIIKFYVLMYSIIVSLFLILQFIFSDSPLIGLVINFIMSFSVGWIMWARERERKKTSLEVWTCKQKKAKVIPDDYFNID